MSELRICHLWPDVLNLYGDRGNVLCMRKRLEWRGVECKVTELPIGERADLTDYDLFFIGGGQDFEQTVLLRDLSGGKADDIRAAVEDGKTFLCVCGGYQLMGKYYETHTGERCDFLGALDLWTVGESERMIGNFAFDFEGVGVVGFENHSGRTYLGPNAAPLGRVLAGHGNNGRDSTEGVRYKNVFGTYSHGPVLPKNPCFCDSILAAALRRKYGAAELAPLPDGAETAAHDAVLSRVLKEKENEKEREA